MDAEILIPLAVLALAVFLYFNLKINKPGGAGKKDKAGEAPADEDNSMGASKLIINFGGKKHISMASEAEKEPAEEAEKKVPEAEKPKKKAAQNSMDELYAREHGMWICPYCETMNDLSSERCSACGCLNKMKGQVKP